jgi:hypothetical protein
VGDDDYWHLWSALKPVVTWTLVAGVLSVRMESFVAL